MRRFCWRDLRKTGKLNKENFPSYQLDTKTELVNLLMTGTTGNKFYCTGYEIAKDMAIAFRDFEDKEFQAKATVYARHKGYIRDAPIVSTVAITTGKYKDLRLFRHVANWVLLTPTDWKKFIDICRSGILRKGLGRALKRKIQMAILTMDEYHALKYPSAVKDMINIARPKESLRRNIIRYIKRKEPMTERQMALEELKRCRDENRVAELIRYAGLPYEAVTGCMQVSTTEVWKALFDIAPYFNLIRNLNTFARHGVFDDSEYEAKAVNRIVDGVKSSMLFPFRFYIAWRYFDHPSHKIKTALEKAIEMSVDNVPELKGRVAICSDVSGSMSGNVTGDYSAVRCIDLVGIFTGMLMKKCRDYLLLPFNEKVKPDIAEEVENADSIIKVTNTLHDLYGGGTSLSAPVEYLLENREKVDYIIAFTDNEEWIGRSFMSALEDYLRFNPEVRVYLVTLMPYRDYPTPEMPNVHYIFGWSDSVIRYICADPEEQLKEIEKIEI